MNAALRALCGLSIALALGEGCAWAALAVAALVASREAPEAPVAAAIKWLRAPTQDALRAYGYVLLCAACAWWLGPYGLLRPQSLARTLPIVAWPITACLAARLSAKERRFVAQVFCISVAMAALIAPLASGLLRDHLQVLVRGDALMAGQGLRPGTSLAAAGGFYFHRLKLAHVLLVALALPTARAIGPDIMGRRRSDLLLLGILVPALLGTFARAAYLGAAVGCASVWMVTFLQHPSARRRLAMLLGVTAIMAALMLLALPEVRQRLASAGSKEASNVRSVIWQQAALIIVQHPWGVGLGNYPEVVRAYYEANEPMTQSPNTYPHNLLLGAWAEGGPLGLLLMALFFVRAVGRAIAVAATQQRSLQDGRRIAALAQLFLCASFFAVGLTHDVLFHNIVALTFFAALGLLHAALDDAAERSS